MCYRGKERDRGSRIEGRGERERERDGVRGQSASGRESKRRMRLAKFERDGERVWKSKRERDSRNKVGEENEEVWI